jgi:hypothetical protein
MRKNLASRLRSSSLTAVPPPESSRDYSRELAEAADSILYRSPLPSPAGLPIYILNAAALPDTHETDYDSLLPYVLARLPGEEELIEGQEYEVVFFAGGDAGETSSKRGRPGWGWFVQAYNVLSRGMRKRLQRLYIVHERSWVRVLTEVFSTIVSPKFRRKIVHGKFAVAVTSMSRVWLTRDSFNPQQPCSSNPYRELTHTTLRISVRQATDSRCVCSVRHWQAGILGEATISEGSRGQDKTSSCLERDRYLPPIPRERGD